MKRLITICAVVVLFGMGYAEAGWTTIDYPGAPSYTSVLGIDGGNLVGYYLLDDGGSFLQPAHGFLYDGTTWTTIDMPGETHTVVCGIDGSNLVGYVDYLDGLFISSRGFLYDGTNWTYIDEPGALSTRVYGIDGRNLVVNNFLYDG